MFARLLHPTISMSFLDEAIKKFQVYKLAAPRAPAISFIKEMKRLSAVQNRTKSALE